MAVCRIRLEAGVRSMRVHGPDGVHDFPSGESCHWTPGHSLEALTEVEYLEITPAKDYDALMSHVRRAAAQPCLRHREMPCRRRPVGTARRARVSHVTCRGCIAGQGPVSLFRV